MNPGNEIVNELIAMDSPLASIPRVAPFVVPDNYFNKLTAKISEAVGFEEEPVLTLPKENPFTLPQGYFKSFTTSLMDKVTEVPSFGSIEAPQQDIPAGYFEQFPVQVLTVVKSADAPQQETTRVISLVPRKVLQWAAAAALVVAAGLGGYKMMNSNAGEKLSAERQLAQLDKEVIGSYVQHHIDEFDTEMLAEGSPVLDMTPEKNIKKLNKKDINEYLDAEGI
jgi:hypothetical protein